MWSLNGHFYAFMHDYFCACTIYVFLKKACALANRRWHTLDEIAHLKHGGGRGNVRVSQVFVAPANSWQRPCCRVE